MNDKDIDILTKYSQEMGLTDGLTLWELIESRQISNLSNQ